MSQILADVESLATTNEVTEVNEVDNLKLRYGENHNKAGQVVTLGTSYIMSFDIKTFEVADYQEIPVEADFHLFKAAFINTMNAFVDAYCKTVVQIAEACEATVKALGPNAKVAINFQSAMSLMGRAQASFDQMAQRVAAWDGKEEVSFILPYAEVLYKDKDMTLIDTAQSKPYITGIMFTAKRR